MIHGATSRRKLTLWHRLRPLPYAGPRRSSHTRTNWRSELWALSQVSIDNAVVRQVAVCFIPQENEGPMTSPEVVRTIASFVRDHAEYYIVHHLGLLAVEWVRKTCFGIPALKIASPQTLLAYETISSVEYLPEANEIGISRKEAAKVPASRSLEANEFFVGTFHPKQTPIDQSNQYELKREANGFWGLMSGKMNWMFSTKSTMAYFAYNWGLLLDPQTDKLGKEVHEARQLDKASTSSSDP
ncbi:hypothetical protein BD769DRAFT_1387994 [Suillus cothurnatus]|nr:hypothetical protein BD769DRAFT_1387994 [Suillus cothurnatus]